MNPIINLSMHAKLRGVSLSYNKTNNGWKQYETVIKRS